MKKIILPVGMLLLVTFCQKAAQAQLYKKFPKGQMGPVVPRHNLDLYAGPVVNRVESTNGMQIKLYIQKNLKSTAVKGIVLMGSGNDESHPTVGQLDDALGNALCNKLAAEGYVCAMVAYRAEGQVNWSDGGTSWNSNCAMLATDFKNVATYISGKYGGSLASTVVGGVSYTSFALLSNLSLNNSPLLGIKGLLAACGATGEWNAQNLKVPVANMVCSGNGEDENNGQLAGAALYAQLPAAVKAQSDCQTDNSCSTHCGGEGSQKWLDFFYNKVKAWLP